MATPATPTPPDLLSSPPSPTDLLALSTLRPPTPLAPPSAPSILNQLLTLISPKWISDFLFSPSPIHVPHLLSPTLPTSAILAHVTTTRSSPEETLHNAAQFLFSPAFIAHPLTLGFGVMSGAELRGPTLDTRIPLVMPIRFLRNAHTREFLMLNDTPNADCILIYYSQHRSPTTSCSFTTRFRRADLLRAINANHGFVDLHTLLPALVHILEETHVRPCPLCGMVAAARCDCVREVTSPRHPFDFDHFRCEFLRDFGTFQGVANKTTGAGVHTVQGVRVRMQAVQNVAAVSALAGSAVRLALGRAQSPWDSVRFGKYGEVRLEGDGVGAMVGEFLSRMGAVGSPVSTGTGTSVGSFMGASGGGESVRSLGGSRRSVGESVAHADGDVDGFDLVGGLEGADDFAGVQDGVEWWELNDSREGGEAEVRSRDVRDDLELAMKRKEADERRKQRNRESAKRSNAKNKKRREEDREELRELQEREVILRARETMLRSENLELRQLVRNRG